MSCNYISRSSCSGASSQQIIDDKRAQSFLWNGHPHHPRDDLFSHEIYCSSPQKLNRCRAAIRRKPDSDTHSCCMCCYYYDNRWRQEVALWRCTTRVACRLEELYSFLTFFLFVIACINVNKYCSRVNWSSILSYPVNNLKSGKSHVVTNVWSVRVLFYLFVRLFSCVYCLYILSTAVMRRAKDVCIEIC